MAKLEPPAEQHDDVVYWIVSALLARSNDVLVLTRAEIEENAPKAWKYTMAGDDAIILERL